MPNITNEIFNLCSGPPITHKWSEEQISKLEEALKEVFEEERKLVTAVPNEVTLDQAFKVVADKYENALEELSKK